MKEGWGKFSLMDICNVTTGKHDANHAEENGKYRFYTCSSQYVYCNTKRYEGECIILPGNGVNVGESYYFNGEFDAYQRTYVIDKIDKKIIIPMYLYYHLQNNWKSKGVAKQYGSATNYIKIGNFKDYIVTIPQSLPEQQSIVDYLDSAFAKIDAMKANAEKALNEAKALFQASLKEMLGPKEGWEYKELGKVCDIVGGGTPDTKNKEYWRGNIPWATVSDMNCDIIKSTGYYITEKGLNESSSRIIKKGEIIIATRVGLGKVCKLAVDTAINQDLKGVIPKDNSILRDFIFYYFKHKAKYIVDNGIGATVKGVKIKFIEGLSFAFPSLSEQQSIVATLDSLKSKVDKLQANYDKISQECDALKQAILRQVFE